MFEKSDFQCSKEAVPQCTSNMSTLMLRKLNILTLHKNYLYNVAKDDFFNDSKTNNVICRKF